MDPAGIIVRAWSGPYRLPLCRGWVTAHGLVRERRGWLVTLEAADGARGYGDCAPWPEYGTEPHGEAEEVLGRALPEMHGREFEAALADLETWRGPPAARCALECALLDLRAKRAGLPLFRCLSPASPGRVRVNAAPGSVLDPDCGARVRAATRAGFRVVKLKVGLGEVGHELAALHALAKGLPRGVTLRLDANGAWDPAQAEAMVRGLRGLPIESLEEPLRGADPGSLRRLARIAAFPLALDESLPLAPDPRAAEPLPVSRLVLKPTRLGGLLPALRLARYAGVGCVVTTMLESAAGHWAAAQLAAALPAGPAHGLGTAGWLARDLGAPPRVRGGEIRLDGRPGLGFRPRREGL